MPGDMDCDCALCLHQTAVTDTRRQIRNLLQYLHELSAQQDAAEAGMPTGAPPTPPVVVRAAPAAALAAHARLVAPDGAGAPRAPVRPIELRPQTMRLKGGGGRSRLKGGGAEAARCGRGRRSAVSLGPGRG
eukprot:Tamp_25133.p3 GENE.Tamp_25133~~Tamp_25133.p3  ORF type:complete len:143 (+),score=13.86 Tamp_25133:35-430(+)